MPLRRRRRTLGPKRSWSGRIVSVQPRIRLTRSFDERTHSYLGYVLRLDGEVDGDPHEFAVAVSKSQHVKHDFRIGDALSGKAVSVADPRTETAEFYRVSALKHAPGERMTEGDDPPWHGLAPSLTEYRRRGHRRLAARTYAARCASCVWGCEMPVEIIIDQWNRDRKRHRRETFCYGPLACPIYRAGPTRSVPGRRGMTYEEEDWVDEEATRHRGADE